MGTFLTSDDEGMGTRWRLQQLKPWRPNKPRSTTQPSASSKCGTPRRMRLTSWRVREAGDDGNYVRKTDPGVNSPEGGNYQPTGLKMDRKSGFHLLNGFLSIINI